MSNDPEFPARTAGDLVLPNGDTVWVSTLNTLLKEQCDEKAAWHAQKECRDLLPGGRDYPTVVAKARAMDAASQAQYIAQRNWYAIQQEAVGKYPDPAKPHRGDMEPDAFSKCVAKWEADCKAAGEKRKKAEQSRYDADVKKALALTEKVRVERCATAYFSEQFGGQFVARMRLETIYRATRLSDDHTRRYFSCAEEVEDAPDGVIEALTKFYFEDLDTVRAEDIPTSPAAS